MKNHDIVYSTNIQLQAIIFQNNIICIHVFIWVDTSWLQDEMYKHSLGSGFLTKPSNL